MNEQIYLREVGPRDGLQLFKVIMSTDRKVEWCRAEVGAGVSEIEVTSFVPPKVIPQFSDADEVAAQTLRISSLEASVLVPNLKGALRAFAHGLTRISFVLSASEQHNLANGLVRPHNRSRTSEASSRNETAAPMLRQLCCRPRSRPRSAAPSRAPWPNPASSKWRKRWQLRGRTRSSSQIRSATSIQPWVRRLFGLVRHAVGTVPLRAHFHDTRGLGIANVSAAVEVGVRQFDASLAGLGGCPFAPRATGNVNIEDTAFLLASLGFETEIDIEAVIAVRAMLEEWLPGEKFFGMVARSGLPLNFAR